MHSIWAVAFWYGSAGSLDFYYWRVYTKPTFRPFDPNTRWEVNANDIARHSTYSRDLWLLPDETNTKDHICSKIYLDIWTWLKMYEEDIYGLPISPTVDSRRPSNVESRSRNSRQSVGYLREITLSSTDSCIHRQIMDDSRIVKACLSIVRPVGNLNEAIRNHLSRRDSISSAQSRTSSATLCIYYRHSDGRKFSV
jgi:hypothetical protein